jgi:hypothetical protein
VEAGSDGESDEYKEEEDEQDEQMSISGNGVFLLHNDYDVFFIPLTRNSWWQSIGKQLTNKSMLGDTSLPQCRNDIGLSMDSIQVSDASVVWNNTLMDDDFKPIMI